MLNKWLITPEKPFPNEFYSGMSVYDSETLEELLKINNIIYWLAGPERDFSLIFLLLVVDNPGFNSNIVQTYEDYVNRNYNNTTKYSLLPYSGNDKTVAEYVFDIKYTGQSTHTLILNQGFILHLDTSLLDYGKEFIPILLKIKMLYQRQEYYKTLTDKTTE